MQQLMPVAVRGTLVYGGPDHGLMVGSLFAGACTVPSDGGLCELYHVDTQVMDTILRAVSLRGGAVGEASVGPWPTPHRTIKVRLVSMGGGAHPSFIRLLLALPPQTPPPQQPLALYTLPVEGIVPCRSGRLFCRSSGHAWTTTIADIYVHRDVLSSWVEEEGGFLDSLTIRTHGRVLFIAVPMGDIE